jgi:hypothetical protein
MDPAARAATPPANSNDAPQMQAAWRDHCLQMAHATEALAHWCDEAEMAAAYLRLAATWKARAAEPRTDRLALP